MAKTEAQPFDRCCGMNETGIDAFLLDVEARDKGTTRYPWPLGLKSEIKAAIDGMTYMPAVKAKINAMVLDGAGPGLFNRGPFQESELK